MRRSTRSLNFVFFISGAILLWLVFGPKEDVLKPGLEELGKLCSKTTDDCYIVKQNVDQQMNIYRFVQSEKHSQNGYFTISTLAMKPGYYGSVVPVRENVQFHYIKAMIIAPYMTEALVMNQPGKLLSIGLGAATLDMFFYTKQPQLDITVVELDETMVVLAARWFDTVEDSRRRTIVADGVEFVEQAVREGTIYDVIALDACNSADAMFRCPAKPFYEFETMQNIYYALKVDGILVLNALSDDLSMIRITLKSHFPSCFIVNLPTSNEMIACLKHDRVPNNLQEKFEFFAKKLGLRGDVGSYKFSVL